MSCVYLLDGHQFNSELELDDFLSEKGYLRKELGDIVFLMNTHVATSVHKVEKLAKETAKFRAEFDYGRSHREATDERDGYNFRDPYIGVNKYLSGMLMADGHILYPEFRKKNYWGTENYAGQAARTYGRFGDWAKGIYTEEEKKFFGDERLGIFKKDLSGNVITLKISDPNQQDKMRALIENKWEHQALIGDAMHSVLQKFFTKVKNEDGTYKLDANGNYVYYKDLLKDPSFKTSFRQLLSKEKYDRADKSKIGFDELIDDNLFENALEKCNTLLETINSKYPDAIFFPEFELTAKVNKIGSNGADTVLGIIDLLVIDNTGKPHIIDYKTSIHEKTDFSEAKKLAYTYQVLFYGRMLAQHGFDISNSDYLIVPIHITDFLYIDKDKYEFSGFNLSPQIYDNLRTEVSDENKHNNLNELIDYLYEPDLSVNNLGLNVLETMSKWFTSYQQYKKYEFEDAKKIAEDSGALKPDENGKLTFVPKGSRTGRAVVTVDVNKSSNPENEMVTKILKWLQDRPVYRETLTKTVKGNIKTGIKNGSVEGITFANGEGESWFSKMMARYCNSNWEVCEGEQFESLEKMGIIVLFNASNRQYNFIKISTLNLKRQFNFGSSQRTTLAGAHKGDLYFKSNPDSMMMLGTYGNIELMETMLVINQIHKMFESNDACLGEVLVADPQLGAGILASSNYELVHCFNELEDSGDSNDDTRISIGNNFKNGKIKVASKVLIARTMLSDAMVAGSKIEQEGGYNRYSNFSSARSMLDTAIEGNESIDKKIQALEKIIELLKTTDRHQELINYTTDSEILAKDHVALYNQCLLAIAELKGINFRQQLRDHASWCETLMIHKEGLSGNMLDNPGNLSSDTLNLLTKLTTEAYQNVRQDILEPAAKLRKLTDALKRKKNFGWLTEHSVGNQASLYQNMYEERNGDIYFKHPDDSSLIKEERDYLNYVLPLINANRHKSAAEAERVRVSDPDRYYRIPICEGDTSVIAAKDGLLAAFKDRIKSWNPKIAWQNAKAKLEGIFDDKLQKDYLTQGDSQKKINIFEMTNMFDYGEGALREKMIARGRYETNMETLTLKHIFAYSMKNRVDSVFPMIKAAMIHLTTSGFAQNAEFKEDLEYGENYVKNKIRNESIIPEQYRGANELANKIKTVASKLVLGFSPVQFLYQTIQGVWQDISLIIRKPDGTDAFTLKNMLAAAKFVYRDLRDFKDRPTLIEHFNRLYGINDMDMNTYVDKIKSDLNGIFNFNNFLFKFASRPDYYNRMTIFVAKMIKEGSFEAHSVNKDGVLEYDCAKDKRYKEFFDDDRSNIEAYNLAKANYIAAARLFEKEHVLNPDGTEFKMDLNAKTKLPRAYTNLEAESMKSLSDTIYGYYSHEKKSMIQATLWGSLYMQFKTFWSGKKNQYLAKGGVKLEGKWVPYTEKDTAGNDIYYYYQKDGDGNILFNEPPVKEGDPSASSEMVVRWEGNWKEGILSTVTGLISEMRNQHSISEGWRSMWYNEDENLRNAYRSNIKLLFYDTMIFLIFGNLIAAALTGAYDDEKKEANKKDYSDALKLSAMNIMIKSMKNSVLDFNFINSIGDPAINWTPFAFEYISNQTKSIWDTVMGDLNIWNTIARSNSLFTLFKPLFYTIKENNKE